MVICDPSMEKVTCNISQVGYYLPTETYVIISQLIIVIDLFLKVKHAFHLLSGVDRRLDVVCSSSRKFCDTKRPRMLHIQLFIHILESSVGVCLIPTLRGINR